MAGSAAYGLTRRELEYELRWMLRKTPTDPGKIPEFLGELMVALIVRSAAHRARR